jgi:hypothetical protein
MHGTQGLSDTGYRAYHVICQLTVLNEGPIAFNERGIAGRCNQSLRKLRQNVDELIKAGNLELADGMVKKAGANPTMQDRKLRPGGNGGQKWGAFWKDHVGVTPPKKLSRRRGNGENEVPSRNTAAESDSWPRDAWEDFWILYPHKFGKGYAQECFDKVRKSRKVTFEDLMAGLHPYIKKSDDRPWCNPSTWLNQDRQLDQLTQKSGSDKNMPAFRRTYAI